MTNFTKLDPFSPAFVKTSATTLSIKAGTTVDSTTYTTDTAISMPTLVPGEDYKVWVHPDGTLEAVHYDSTSSIPGSVVIGGFHYLPVTPPTDFDLGASAGATIGPYTLWDLKYRPACPNPRGMYKHGNANVWEDIYWLNTDYVNSGTSRNNKTIATGSNTPIRAYDYGGYGTSKYANFIYWNAVEIVASVGKRLGTYQEHCNGAFGVRENMGRGSHPITTGIATSNVGARHPDEYFVSKWGGIQVTGCLWAWTESVCSWQGTRGSGATADTINGWDWWAYTGGKVSPLEGSRGQMLLQNDSNITILLHGGKYGYEDGCGSRCVETIERPWDNSANIGARGFADHFFQV